MTWKNDGYLYLPQLIAEDLLLWREITAREFALGKPGHRITDNPALAAACDRLLMRDTLRHEIGSEWRCVRAIAFNKSSDANWTLGWHQDRTIAVKERVDVNGFGPWSTKDGIPHVEPPFAIIEDMFTLRLHLDDARQDNGALLIAPESHKHGLIPEAQVGQVAQACGTKICEAQAGDGWLYTTPILHASGRASNPSSRRVLHLDFSRDELPPHLEWHGIG